MYICERCGCEHDGTFGTGRFCSSYCQHHREKLIPIKSYEDEIWLPVKGFESSYDVSNYGRVARNVNGRRYIINPRDVRGYKRVSFTGNGKVVYDQVHRVVLSAFCPIENSDEMQVNHKNEIKSDNRLENLEWCTAKYNANYGSHKDSISKKVICITTGVIYMSIREASNAIGISESCISKCCHGKAMSAGGYEFKFYSKE